MYGRRTTSAMNLRRSPLALFLVAILSAQGAISTAQPTGSELTNDVSADAAGPEASVQLQGISAFPPSGEAMFEPHTHVSELALEK